MAISSNPLLASMSGKLENIVVKQYEGKTVVTSMPDMSHRKLSSKQKEANTQMMYAIKVAQGLTSTPVLKQRACELLNVPSNKVFRAIVKDYLLTDGRGPLYDETPQEKEDSKTLTALKTIITSDIPDAEIRLFGDRAKNTHNAQSDWDILILTTTDYPKAVKWELQEKLFEVTIQQGARVNILLVQKNKWLTEPEYAAIREKIEGELAVVK